jgi:plasmid stabilization system protein ParE
MARLVVSRETQGDLDEILAYLTSAAGKSAALRYGERFRGAFRILGERPGNGDAYPAWETQCHGAPIRTMMRTRLGVPAGVIVAVPDRGAGAEFGNGHDR